MSLNFKELAEERESRRQAQDGDVEERASRLGRNQPTVRMNSNSDNRQTNTARNQSNRSSASTRSGFPASAKDETFTDALRIALCPSLTIRSFSFIIVCFNIKMFLVSLLIEKMSTADFLAPSSVALDRLGQKDCFKIKEEYQVWRLITPVFLHANFMHLFSNSLSTFMLGSGVEASLKFKRTMLLYFVSGFGGVLFSSVCQP